MKWIDWINLPSALLWAAVSVITDDLTWQVMAVGAAVTCALAFGLALGKGLR